VEHLRDVVALRITVFYPNQVTNFDFHEQVYHRLLERQSLGANCLVASVPFYPESSLRDIIGTIEFSAFDFKGSSMEHAGAQNKLYVMDLAVREDCRRAGVASQLLAKVEEYALANNFEEVYLHVEKTNDVAQSFYRANGFTVMETSAQTTAFTRFRLPFREPHEYLLLKRVVPENKPAHVQERYSPSNTHVQLGFATNA
jgi:ribosomal protein S18 acetylase RimI-like enzyme